MNTNSAFLMARSRKPFLQEAAPCTSMRRTTSVFFFSASSTCCLGIPLYSPYTTACSSSCFCSIHSSNCSVLTKK